MVRYCVVLNYEEDGSYKTMTERGIAAGPTAQEALTQIEEYYGDDIEAIRIEYSDDMSDKIYAAFSEEDYPWLTKSEGGTV